MPTTDCSIGGCGWAGLLCLDVGSACDDKTACKDAYKLAHLHCKKTQTFSDVADIFDCTTADGQKTCKAQGRPCCRDPNGEPDSMCLRKGAVCPSALASEAPALDCQTDQQHDLVMTIVNPSKSKVKVKTCDARSVNGSTAACQGNPLKPNCYRACGAPNDRVMPATTRDIHFNSNTTYITFSNGV